MGVDPAISDRSLRRESLNALSKTICHCNAVRRIDRGLNRIYDEALRPIGLVTTQFSLLSVINRAPDDLTLAELADATDTEPSTLSRNIAVLTRNDLVEVRAGTDRRTRVVQLTVAGRARLAEGWPLWEAVQRRIAGEQNAEVAALIDRLTYLIASTPGYSTPPESRGQD